MPTPTHLTHKPITAIDNYSQHDGIYKHHTDAQSLSIGEAQYNREEISAKVFRYVNGKWSRQSEELPLHRVFDLSITALKSILMSANIPQPATTLDINVINPQKLEKICSYYKSQRDILRPKLQELQILLNYFMNEEPKL